MSKKPAVKEIIITFGLDQTKKLKISNMESHASLDELATYCKDIFALSKEFDESTYGFKALPQMLMLSNINEIKEKSQKKVATSSSKGLYDDVLKEANSLLFCDLAEEANETVKAMIKMK